MFFHARENIVLVLRKLIQIIHKIHEQEFRGECLGKGGLHPEIKGPAAQQITAMAFVVVDNSFIVELRRPDAEPVTPRAISSLL